MMGKTFDVVPQSLGLPFQLGPPVEGLPQLRRCRIREPLGRGDAGPGPPEMLLEVGAPGGGRRGVR